MWGIIEPEAADAATTESVQAQVDDWAERIARLYRDLRDWLPSDFSFDETQTVLMDEEMMRRHGVAERQLPVLNIHDRTGWRAKVIPSGLWIIGANGRLSALVGTDWYTIAGGEPDREQPDWRIISPDRLPTLRTLDRQAWNEAFR